MRVAIAGVPRAGKTTMAAEKFGNLPTYHTDDLIGLGWSEASAAAAAWFNLRGPLCVEGMAVPRALRKWLEFHKGKPVDQVIWLGNSHLELAGGQGAMGKGAWTVMEEIVGELLERGVMVAML